MIQFEIEGNIVDVIKRKIIPGKIQVVDDVIKEVIVTDKSYQTFIIPGLIDAHVHIESSMLIPHEFSKMSVRGGTVACIADPHEIANVLGKEGVKFMIDNSKQCKTKFIFGAPSCVPATDFETSGSVINKEEIKVLLEWDDVGFLSEVMNYPAVINDEEEILGKISAARNRNVKIDGHAPGLTGKDLRKYISAGISTDHECSDLVEAREKLKAGMHIQIREGSAAKGLENLLPLLEEAPEKVMFCTDDIHPDDLVDGHMNILLKKIIEKGYDIFDAIRAMSLNPGKHYGFKAGMIQKGDPADFCVVNNLKEFRILNTFIDGVIVFPEEEQTEGNKKLIKWPNNFCTSIINEHDIEVSKGTEKIRIIVARDGDLSTGSEIATARFVNNKAVTDVDRDILKIVVLNRYRNEKPTIGFIRGFGLKKGAIGSSIAHDSHNIICVGENDRDIVKAINYIIEARGGIVVAEKARCNGMPLPVAGIMSDQNGYAVARKYKEINASAKNLGTLMTAPLMTLSFMALLVIPELKISDKGLFDVNEFCHTNLFI